MSNFINDPGNLPPLRLLPEGFIRLAGDKDLPYCLQHVSGFRYHDDDAYYDKLGRGSYGIQLVGFDPKTELFYVAAALNCNWGNWENRFVLTKRPATCMTFTIEQQQALLSYAKKLRGPENKGKRKILRRMAELCRDGCPRMRAKILRMRTSNDAAYCRTRGPVKFYLAMFAHPRHQYHSGDCEKNKTEQGTYRCEYFDYSYIMQGYGATKHEEYEQWGASPPDAYKYCESHGCTPISTLAELDRILRMQNVLREAIGTFNRFDKVSSELLVFRVSHPHLYLPKLIQPNLSHSRPPSISWGSLVSGEERPIIESVDISKQRFAGWKNRVNCRDCGVKITPRCQCCRICEKVKPAAFKKLPKKRQKELQGHYDHFSRSSYQTDKYSGGITCKCKPGAKLGSFSAAWFGVDQYGE